MSAITIGNDLVHYEVLGRGKPIVFVHSWLGSWRYWIPTINQLGSKYRTYALDLWGFGDSGKSRNHYHLEGQVALIRAFVEKMGIPKAVFVGHGLGAAVLAHYAIDPKYSGKVHKLFVISPPVFDTAPAQAPTKALTESADITETLVRPELGGIDREKLRQAALEMGLNSIASKGGKTTSGSSSTGQNQKSGSSGGSSTSTATKGDVVFPNPVADIMGDMDPLGLLAKHMDTSSADYDKLKTEVAKANKEVIETSTQSFRYISTYQELLKLKMPTFTLFGQSDTFMPLPDKPIRDKLNNTAKSKVAMVMQNTRHFPMLEDTTKFVRLLRDFLETPDISSLEMKEEWRRRNR